MRIFAYFHYSYFPHNEKNINFHEKLATPYPHLEIKYNLYPNLNIKFKGKDFSTNSDGFRTNEFSTKNSYRILGLGDSVLMGWGVSDNETYLKQLENLFSNDSKKVETVNLGILGHNTVQEYFVLKEFGIDLSPDLVILQFVGNDINRSTNYTRVSPLNSYSYLANFIHLKYKILTKKESRFAYYDWRKVKSDIEQEKGFEWAFKKIIETCKRNSFPLLVILDSRYVSANYPHSKVVELANSYNIKTINLFEILRDIPENTPSQTSINDQHNLKYLIEIGSGRDNHTNKHWHKDVSKIIYKFLKENKI